MGSRSNGRLFLSISDLFVLLFQKLQGDIHIEYKIFQSVAEKTKRTSSCVGTSEEAVALMRKMEEISERWDYVKTKSADIK